MVGDLPVDVIITSNFSVEEDDTDTDLSISCDGIGFRIFLFAENVADLPQPNAKYIFHFNVANKFG